MCWLLVVTIIAESHNMYEHADISYPWNKSARYQICKIEFSCVLSLAAATSFVGQLVSLATRLMLDPPEPRTPRSQTLAQLFSTVHLQMHPQLSSCAYRDTVVAKVTQIPTTTFGEFQFTPN